MSRNRFMIALLLAAGGCEHLPADESAVVKGPEDPSLARTIAAYVLTDEPLGGITAYDVRSGAKMTIRTAGERRGFIHAVAGPDATGRIAYILETSDRFSEVKTARITEDAKTDKMIDGSTLIRVRGSALWDDVLGLELALSHTNGRVALIQDVKSVQLRDPSALFGRGTITIVDLDGPEGKPHLQRTAIESLDNKGMSWTPDGVGLLKVDLMDREQVERMWGKLSAANNQIGMWSRIPVVIRVDTRTLSERPCCVGTHPVVSTDGKTMLVWAIDGYSLVNLDDGAVRGVTWPGDRGGAVIGFVESTIVVYRGYPTEGQDPGYSRLGTPWPGKRYRNDTIKIALIDSKRFRTIVHAVDPRKDLGFGLIESPAHE
jgi:hypothetical protein